MKKVEKSEKGITLIALIISIIIVIILSAVVIIKVAETKLVEHTIDAASEYATKQNNEMEQFDEVAVSVDSRAKQIESIGGTGGENAQYTPNGNANYSKEHQITIESNENTKSIKYQWVKKGEEPIESEFIELTNSEKIITKNDISGIWYVCFLIETQDGQQHTEKTQDFYFDNIAPTVELTSSPVSEQSFILSAKAEDNMTKMLEYKFYVNNKPSEPVNSDKGIVTHTVEGANTGETECYVIVRDEAGNETKKTIKAKTQYHTWEKWNIKRVYTLSSSLKKTGSYYFSKTYDVYKRDPDSAGKWMLNLVNASVSWTSLNQYIGCYTISDDKTEVLHMTKLETTNPNNKCITVNVYSSSTFKTEESKGTTRQGYVNSTSASAYPKNGITGSYYYIYAGLKD